MAVEWIGDTVNTLLKANYDTAVSKIDELKNILTSENIDTEYVNNLYINLDTLTTDSLNIVVVIMDKILAVINCFVPIDPSTKSEILNAMKDTINEILSGEILIAVIASIQNLIDNIGDIINETIEVIEAAINEILNVINNIINSIGNALSSIEVLDETVQIFSQAMSKVAAFINCLEDAIFGDTQLGDNIEKVDPTLKDVISDIREAKNAGKDKTTILNEANEKIASNLNLNDKFADVKNKISSIV